MMLLVDFNMVQPDGRIPALIPSGSAWELAPGTKVIATDGEGTECTAIVEQLDMGRRYVLLAPVGGTTVRETDVTPNSSDRLVS